MKKFALAAIAATVVGLVASAMPAQAQQVYQIRDDGLGCIDSGNCSAHRYVNRWNDGTNWNSGYRWNNNYYRPNYGYGVGYNPAYGIAAGAVGLAAGAAMANAYDNSRYVAVDDHVAQCQARYRSYNPETNMFLGYDGEHHYCRL